MVQKFNWSGSNNCILVVETSDNLLPLHDGEHSKMEMEKPNLQDKSIDLFDKTFVSDKITQHREKIQGLCSHHITQERKSAKRETLNDSFSADFENWMQQSQRIGPNDDPHNVGNNGIKCWQKGMKSQNKIRNLLHIEKFAEAET